jgi:uncharacterized protein (TIGR02246 family)
MLTEESGMRQWLVTVFLLTVGTICVALALANDQPKVNGNRTTERPASKVVTARPKAELEAARTAPVKITPQEAAVKHATESLLTAYKRNDAKAFAATFTVEGEYIDTKDIVFYGRKAITDEFAAFFRDTPGSSMKIDVVAIRSIARNLISADCTTHFKLSESVPSVSGRCRIVLSRETDVWQIASLQEWDSGIEELSHHAHVSQLDWMVGEWIGEGRNSHVHFFCRWDESMNYLRRDFTIEVAGATPLTGTQRIGYDPMTHRLKMWVFDSAGGFSEGFFNRDGEKWILKTSGVTSDGYLASATNTFTLVDDHRMTAETTEHFISGERIADTENLTIVRKPPRAFELSDQSQRQKN